MYLCAMQVSRCLQDLQRIPCEGGMQGMVAKRPKLSLALKEGLMLPSQTGHGYHQDLIKACIVAYQLVWIQRCIITVY